MDSTGVVWPWRNPNQGVPPKLPTPKRLGDSWASSRYLNWPSLVIKVERALGLNFASLEGEKERERERKGERERERGREITKWISKHTSSKEIKRKRRKKTEPFWSLEIHQAQESQAPPHSCSCWSSLYLLLCLALVLYLGLHLHLHLLSSHLLFCWVCSNAMHGHINLRLRDANHNHPQKRLWKMVLKLKSLHGGPHRLQNDLVPTTTMHGHTNLVKHPGFLGCGFLSKAHQTHKKLGLGVGLPKAWRQPNITKKLGLGWQRIGRGFVVPTGCAQSSSSHSFLPSRDYSSESRPEVVRRVISADADQVNGGQIPLEVWFTGFLSQLASSKLLGFHHTSSSPSPAYVFYPTDWVELWHLMVCVFSWEKSSFFCIWRHL